MSTQINPTFDLPVLRHDPFLDEVQQTQAVFAVSGGHVLVIRNGVEPDAESRLICGIDFSQDIIRFGNRIRVDSDLLRHALEEHGL